MEQVGYQGYAQGGGFSPVQVSSANVSRIEKEGARILRGMQEAAEYDLKSRRAYLAAMQENQGLERKARERNQQIKLQGISNKKADSRRDYEIESGNIVRKAEAQQEIFKTLSTLSSKAGELAASYVQTVGEAQEKEQYWQDMMYGVDPEAQLKERHTDHQMQIYGEQMDQETDKLQAVGADPIQVNQFRNLNRWQRRGRERAMIERAGMDWNDWMQDKFRNDTETRIQIPGEDGQPRTITPAEAATSPDQAALLPILFNQFMQERGLFGMKSARLEPMYLKVRTANEALLSRTRKIEMRESQNKRIDEAKDMVYDAFDSTNVVNYYNVLRRSLDANGMPLGHSGARQQLMEMIFTATDENGNLQYSPSQLEEFGNMVFPGQNKTIKEQYSAQWAEMTTKRAQTENQLFGLQEATKQRGFGQYNNDLRDWLNSGSWDGSNDALEPLLEKAQRDGNAEAIRMLQMYQTDLSNDGRNDKFYTELWEDKLVQGLLTVEEVRTANVSSKLKLDFMPKAEKSQQNAMSPDRKEMMEDYIKSSLSSRIGQFDRNAVNDPSFSRAYYAAKTSFLSEFTRRKLAGDTDEQAHEFALQRFQKDFNDEKGRYRIADQDPNNPNIRRRVFAGFLVTPAAAEIHPMTHARDIINANKGNPSILETEGLMNRGELQRISSAVKAGRPFSIPKSAQYLANMYGGSVTASDVLNAQMKHYGIDQIPIKAYEKALSAIDPEYQRLLTYRPNHTRLNIAAYGSGITDAVPTRRQRGAVNGPTDILSTFIAAGGDQKEAAIMTAIAMAESSGRQDAHNNNRNTGDNSFGWWQINMIDDLGVARRKQFGLRSDQDLFDPMINAKAAIAIRKSQGLGAWSVYRNGAYKQFLPQAEAAMRSFGSSPWRQGSTMNFNVVQYLTGDRSYRNPNNPNQFYYAPDHGGANYHEHVGFRSRQDRDRAIATLKKHGIKIGSMNDGVHADGSLHYQDRAVDLPMPFHIKPGSREEQAYSRRVRKILGIPG